MKKTINLGAYGWRQTHWSAVFYPQDLPMTDDDDWRLSYYSNEFNAVLVPADYWPGADADDWLDSVHAEFQFFVECRADMLDGVSLAELSAALKKLKPQLAALVFPDEPMPEVVKNAFIALADGLAIEVFDVATGTTDFLCIEDDLSDLRASRATVEQFAAQLDNDDTEATIIVHHERLQASALGKFRAMLEIMGY